jgi:hypothetical protein
LNLIKKINWEKLAEVMPESLISNEELKRKLVKLLRRKYEESNWQRRNRRRTQVKLNRINYKIQLIKTMCQRRLIDMAKIKSVISTWKLMSNSDTYQKHTVVEPMAIEEVVEDVLEKH